MSAKDNKLNSSISATENSELPYKTDFKGLWMPREIYLRRDINALEKFLWTEIYTLHDREKGGCFASEEFFCERLGIQRRNLYKMLKHLKDIGLVEDVHFDGRMKIRKAVYTQEDTNSASPQKCTKVHGSGAQKCTHPIIYKNTVENIRTQVAVHSTATRSSSVSSQKSSKIERALHVNTSDEEHEKLVKVHGENFVQNCYTRLSMWKTDKPKTKWMKDDYRTILRWVVDAVKEDVRKLKGTDISQAEANKKLAKAIEEKFKKLPDTHKLRKSYSIEALPEYISISQTGNSYYSFSLKYTEHGFKDQLESEMRKRGIM